MDFKHALQCTQGALLQAVANLPVTNPTDGIGTVDAGAEAAIRVDECSSRAVRGICGRVSSFGTSEGIERAVVHPFAAKSRAKTLTMIAAEIVQAAIMQLWVCDLKLT
jgi:hypothetical protein